MKSLILFAQGHYVNYMCVTIVEKLAPHTYQFSARLIVNDVTQISILLMITLRRRRLLHFFVLFQLTKHLMQTRVRLYEHICMYIFHLVLYVVYISTRASLIIQNK